MQQPYQHSTPNLLRVADRPVTQADLKMFKEELLKEIKLLVQDQPRAPRKKWLKNKAVAEMLEITVGTLQVLRDNGTIPHTRIGRNIYYDPDDIERELQRRKTAGRFRA